MSHKIKLIAKYILILSLGVWIYYPVFNGNFIWDDAIEIVNHTTIQGSWKSLVLIWQHGDVADYLPLKTTVQWVEWHLFGLNPLGYHLFSIGLHILNASLLYRILKKRSFAFAWLASVLFLSHPLAVESVAWISELKNTLSLLFLLLAYNSLLAYESMASTQKYLLSKSHYIISVALFACSVLSKSSVVMAPIVLFIYYYNTRSKHSYRKLRYVIPYLSISFFVGSVTLWSQHVSYIKESFLVRLAALPMLFLFYIKQWFFPTNLFGLYPRWNLQPVGLLTLACWIILAVLMLTVVRFRSRSVYFYGSLFFAVNIFPVLGLLPMYYTYYAWVGDQLVYLPCIGLAVISSYGLWNLNLYFKAYPKFINYLSLLLTVLIVTSFSVISHNLSKTYHNSESFWSYVERGNTESWVVEQNLGQALGFQSDKVHEAIVHYQLSLRLNKTNAEAHHSLGLLYEKLGNHEDAISEFESAVKLRPDFIDAHIDLANVLSLGENKFEQAIYEYNLALNLNPALTEVQCRIAELYKAKGCDAQAIEHFNLAIKLKPHYVEAENNLANLLARTAGSESQAAKLYEDSLEYAPDAFLIHFNYAMLLKRMPGKLKNARAELITVLKINPEFIPAQEALSRISPP